MKVYDNEKLALKLINILEVNDVSDEESNFNNTEDDHC